MNKYALALRNDTQEWFTVLVVCRDEIRSSCQLPMNHLIYDHFCPIGPLA